jgi:hypothetical protein
MTSTRLSVKCHSTQYALNVLPCLDNRLIQLATEDGMIKMTLPKAAASWAEPGQQVIVVVGAFAALVEPELDTPTSGLILPPGAKSN